MSQSDRLLDLLLETDDPGGPNLTLRFKKHVFFGIKTSADLRSIVVSVKKKQLSQKERKRSPKDIITVQQQKKVSKSILSKQPPASPSEIDLSSPYAINLLSTQNHRMFSFNIKSNENIRIKVTDDMSDLIGPDWTLKFLKNIQYQFTGSGKSRQITISFPPDGAKQTPSKREHIEQKAPLYVDYEHPIFFQDYRLYQTQFKTDDGKLWNRLRLGFFPTRDAALEVLESLGKTFPNAWITKVSMKERKMSGQRVIAVATLKIKPVLTALEESSQKKQLVTPETEKRSYLPLIPIKRITSLMNEAEVAMTGGNYRRAIQIYTKILEDREGKKRKEAQELLGLARERNGQIAHAKAEYENFLQLYPEGEDAVRVRQRLAGLLTARAKPKEKLRKAKPKDKMEYYGSISQFYYYDETTTDIGGKIVNRSSLSNDVDLNARKRSSSYDLRALFIGGYEADFTDNSDNESRINTFYIDALQKQWNLSGRFGRQSQSTGGVLGRFDGGLVTYQLASKIKINAVGGFPVTSATLDEFETEKYFYGMSFDLGTFASHWDINRYFIQQEYDGIIDRQAIGGEIRFFHPNATFFTLTDYDTYHDELNIMLFTGNVNLPSKTTINMTADYRNSPILTTSNALQGQVGIESLNDLTKIYSIDEIREIALNRTARSKSFMIGAVHPFNQKLQIGTDVTVSKFSSLDPHGTILFAVPGTDYEYIYSLQFIGSSLIKNGDIAILGLSFSDATTFETYSANLNTRYPISRNWRVNPRVNVNFRQNKNSQEEQLKIRPLLRMDYRWRKAKIRFEFEIGGEWVNTKLPIQTEKTTGFFTFVGYRWDF